MNRLLDLISGKKNRRGGRSTSGFGGVFDRGFIAKFLGAIVLIGVVGGGGYWLGFSQSPAGLEGPDEESLRVYAEALDAVRNDYVDQAAIDPEKQTSGAIRGMLDSLGDKGHTRFLTPAERRDNQQGLSGRYVGVGIQIEESDGRVVVSAPIEGSPAEQAGVRSGDVIVAVGGRRVNEENASGISERVRGPEGSEVRITVERDGKERAFDLTREQIDSPAASWGTVPGTDVAQVRLASFSDNSADEVQKSVAEAVSAGASGVVLDLRDNPGGRLDQAVGAAELFLDDGEVIYIRQNASGERERVRVSGDPEFPDVPLVVLVNGGSASSSEILSGALRDNGRAEVVGQTTFGTGTVLAEFDLSDGSAMLLGIAEWLTPNGDFIRETGIEPDVKATLAKDGEEVVPNDLQNLDRGEVFDRDQQLQRAVEELGGS